MHELALFAGAGGGILGGKLLGWRTVCAVERDAYCAAILAQRQNDGLLEPFPIWSDVCSFDGKPWRGIVDVISGGFPCQNVSIGGDGQGLDGEKSRLWKQMARVIREVGSRFVLVENSSMLTLRGLDRVLGDLASMGYDAKWGVLGAEDSIWLVGRPSIDHERERIWIVAESNAASNGCDEARYRAERYLEATNDSQPPEGLGPAFPDTCKIRREGPQWHRAHGAAWLQTAERCCTDNWQAEPNVGRVADGVAHVVDRIRAIGNGQVPAVVRLAWRLLTIE